MTCNSEKLTLTSLSENIMPDDELQSFLKDLNDATQRGDETIDPDNVWLKTVDTQVLIICTVQTLDLMLKAFAANPKHYKEAQIGSHVCFFGKIGDKNCVLMQCPNKNKSERDGLYNFYPSAAIVCKHEFAFAVE